MAAPMQANTILIVKPLDPASQSLLQNQLQTERLRYHCSTEDLGSSWEERRLHTLEIHLQFDPPPRDITRGFVFGRDEEQCDIVLTDIPAHGHQISKTHFRIDFNWESGLPRLVNLSSETCTTMLAPSFKHGKQLLRYDDMAFLSPNESTVIQIHDFKIQISFPVRGQHQHQYERNWQQFCRKRKDLLAPNERSNYRPNQYRHSPYRFVEMLDRDKNGALYKIGDPSGTLYAAKSSYSSDGWDVKKYIWTIRRLDINHVSVLFFEVLGKLLTYLQAHIVTFLDTFFDVREGAFLVLDYMPCGNLQSLDEITPHELGAILWQSLQALQYLHNEKRIPHGNITPANTLVQSRIPELRIKLGDLALPLQRQCSFSRKFYGTPRFDPPETCFGISASQSADIWSLAAVACAASECLPEYTARLSSEEWAERMFEAVQTEAKGVHGSVGPLLKWMLSPDLLNRPSVRECLSHPSIQKYASIQPRTVKTEGRFAEAWPRDFTFETPPPLQPSLQGLADDMVSLDQCAEPARPAKQLRFSSSSDNIQSPPNGSEKLPTRANWGFRLSDSMAVDMRRSSQKKREILRLKVPRSRLTCMDTSTKTSASNAKRGKTESPPFAPQPSHEELDRLPDDVQRMQISTAEELGSQTRKRVPKLSFSVPLPGSHQTTTAMHDTQKATPSPAEATFGSLTVLRLPSLAYQLSQPPPNGAVDHQSCKPSDRIHQKKPGLNSNLSSRHAFRLTADLLEPMDATVQHLIARLTLLSDRRWLLRHASVPHFQNLRQNGNA
ncbi:MAG: hypothetical protein Q9216_005589 [Gyalolechia sp. 2 TL-2023]